MMRSDVAVASLSAPSRDRRGLQPRDDSQSKTTIPCRISRPSTSN